MIRELRKADINIVADIWLDTNIKAHCFIPAQYWKRNSNCFVGGNIREAMEKPLAEAQMVMEQSMAMYSLKDSSDYIDKKIHF